MCDLTSQKIPMMQMVLQLFTVKGILCIILGDIQLIPVEITEMSNSVCPDYIHATHIHTI